MGECTDGTTFQIGICIHNCQYICQYAINFKDFTINVIDVMVLMVYVYVKKQYNNI